MTRKYTAHENSHRSTTQILGSYLKFKGQNLGYLSPIFWEAKFGALKQISEANFGAKPPGRLTWKCPPGDSNESDLKTRFGKDAVVNYHRTLLNEMIIENVCFSLEISDKHSVL